VLDIRRFQHVNAVFCQLNMCHMCGCRELRGIFREGVGTKRACGKVIVDSHHPCAKDHHSKNGNGISFTCNQYTCVDYSLYELHI
jgi:hypothetical protein